MATLTIRALDPEVKDRLRVQAAVHGRSMEEEVRLILRTALLPELPGRLGTSIHERFAALGGAELPEPDRSDMPRAADFGE